jgi:hypothetical protein
MSAAITGTVNSAFRIGEAAVQTGEAAVKTAKGVVETAQATTETAKEGVTIVKKVGENINVGLEESKKVVETSINTLNEQLGNVNENTTSIMKMTNQTIQKASPHLSNTVGNATEMTSNVTSVVNDSIKSAGSIIGSLLSVIKYPFDGLQSTIENIQKSKDTPNNKIEKIITEIKKKFKTTKNDTINKFEKQLKYFIKNIEKSIHSYKRLSCKKGFWDYNCDDNIKENINNFEIIKENLESEIETSKNDIKIILDGFDISFDAIKKKDISQDNLESNINYLQNEYQEIQSDLLNQAISKFSEIMKEYQSTIYDIKEFVKNVLIDKNVFKKNRSELHVKDESIQPVIEENNELEQDLTEEEVKTNGGSRKKSIKNKSKKSKKTVKHNKSKKTNKSKKSKK